MASKGNSSEMKAFREMQLSQKNYPSKGGGCALSNETVLRLLENIKIIYFQENIRQVVNMTTKALKHLLEYEGM